MTHLEIPAWVYYSMVLSSPGEDEDVFPTTSKQIEPRHSGNCLLLLLSTLLLPRKAKVAKCAIHSALTTLGVMESTRLA